MICLPPTSTLFPYTTLFRSTYTSPSIAGSRPGGLIACCWTAMISTGREKYIQHAEEIWNTVQHIKESYEKKNKKQTNQKTNKKDRKSTRLNSSHVEISYAVF